LSNTFPQTRTAVGNKIKERKTPLKKTLGQLGKTGARPTENQRDGKKEGVRLKSSQGTSMAYPSGKGWGA